METLKSMSSEELKKLVGNDQGVSEGQESTTTLPTIGFAHQIVDGFKKVTSMVNPLSYFGAAPPTYDFPSKVVRNTDRSFETNYIGW